MSEIKETNFKPIPALTQAEQHKITQIAYAFAQVWTSTDEKETLTPSLDMLAGEISRIITSSFTIDANQTNT
jgi:hypothetical protein